MRFMSWRARAPRSGAAPDAPGAFVPVTLAAAAGMALGLILAPAAGHATPATESDLVEIHEGVFSFNGTASYQTDYVFRGVKQAADVTTLQLKTSLDTGILSLHAGAKGFMPLQSQHDGIDEPKEVDLFAAARFNLAELIVAEAGATYYYYPGADDTGTTDPHSLELYGGIDLPIIIPMLIRAYYDVDYENTTVETKGRWRQPVLGDKLKLEINSVVGYVNTGDEGANVNAARAGARTPVGDGSDSFAPFDADDHRFYYGVGAGVSSQLTDNVSVGANVNWQGTTGEFYFDGETDDETLWGGVSFNIGL